MAFRIHFTQDDLLRLSLTQEPDPLHETVASLRLIQRRRPGPVFGPWRRWALTRIPRSVHLLRALVPPHGPLPDFLTPPGTRDLEEGLDNVLHTPKSFLRTDLESVARVAARPLPSWVRSLADGNAQNLQSVASAVRDWHQAVIAPLGQHVDARIEAARLSAARPLMTSGVDAMLSQLHPTISWAPPVLELATSDHDWDIHLDGRGLRLIPSYFYSREPAIHLDPDLPPIVIYPITHDTVWSPRPAPVLRPRHDTLAALLGHRRATLLQVITVGHGISTSALAHRTGVSPATVSHHTTALRDAGLITTHRAGGSAHHLPTPLGVQLVNGG